MKKRPYVVTRDVYKTRGEKGFEKLLSTFSNSDLGEGGKCKFFHEV